MAGFFDFLKQGSGNQPVENNTNQSQSNINVASSSKTQSYSGVGATPSGGQPYSGIGPTPSGGRPYSGIGQSPLNNPQNLNSQIQVNSLSQGNNSSALPKKDYSNIQKSEDKSSATPSTTGKTTNKPELSAEEKKHQQLDLMTHLTQRSNRVFLSAQTKAKELKNDLVDSEHLLHGLLSDSEIYNFFIDLKIQPQLIEEELSKIYKNGNFDKIPQLSPRLKRILDNSLVIARKLGFEFISPEHLLLSLYEEGEGAGARILAKLGLKKEDLNKKIIGKKDGLEAKEKQEEKNKNTLEKFTIDLTAKASQGLLDPVVERSEVIERVIHILSRRTKNNPALVGEAGVGKTAIVEGLAQKIVAKQVPETLLNKKILQLDLMSVLAGASHRGEFEERMKDIIEQIKNSQGQIILFIDEIHNIVGAGSSGEGSLDASNFLKPALARGELQMIGATTLTEYRKYIEKDPALERRFQPVLVLLVKLVLIIQKMVIKTLITPFLGL